MTSSTIFYGKESWRPVLEYTYQLHKKSTYPPEYPLPFPWEEIGPGYRRAFGHWDIMHQCMDGLLYDEAHVKNQLYNLLATQEPSGMLPGSVWMDQGINVQLDTAFSHPPMWVYVADQYYTQTEDLTFLLAAYKAVVRQISWFDVARKAQGEGYYYTDILNHQWESGVDDGVRFDNIQTGAMACIDATAHVQFINEYAARWARILGRDPQVYQERAEELRQFIQNKLYDQESGFFYDIWSMEDPSLRRIVFEGLFPVICGSASQEQAMRVIDESLLNPARFFSQHPVTTVSMGEAAFELRMWKGPAWNSMTCWAAIGCLRYGRKDAAAAILERALDATAAQFAQHGLIFEFYHPQAGDQSELTRKPYTDQNAPYKDYLGHNPLLAMAHLWQQAMQP